MRTHLFHHCIPLKGQLIVVVQVRELFLRHLNPTGACDVVDSPFSKHFIQLITLVVEACASDLSALIKQIDTEQFAFSIFVVPSLDIGFVRTAGFNSPLVCIRRECFDRVDVGMRARGRVRSRSLWDRLLLRRLGIIAIEAACLDGC